MMMTDHAQLFVLYIKDYLWNCMALLMLLIIKVDQYHFSDIFDAKYWAENFTDTDSYTDIYQCMY